MFNTPCKSATFLNFLLPSPSSSFRLPIILVPKDNVLSTQSGKVDVFVGMIELDSVLQELKAEGEKI